MMHRWFSANLSICWNNSICRDNFLWFMIKFFTLAHAYILYRLQPLKVQQPTWPAILSRSLWPWEVSLRPLQAHVKEKQKKLHLSIIQITATRYWTEFSLSPIWVLLHHFEAFQSLKDLPRHVSGANAEVGRTYTVPLTPSIDLDHGSNADPSSQVQVPSCGCWWNI